MQLLFFVLDNAHRPQGAYGLHTAQCIYGMDASIGWIVSTPTLWTLGIMHVNAPATEIMSTFCKALFLMDSPWVVHVSLVDQLLFRQESVLDRAVHFRLTISELYLIVRAQKGPYL